MFNRLKLQTRMIAAFLLVTVLVLVIGIAGLLSMKSLEKSIEEIGSKNLPAVQAIDGVKGAILGTLAAQQALGNPDSVKGKSREVAFEVAESNFEAIEKHEDKLDSMSMTPAETRLWKKFKPIAEEWEDDHEKIVALSTERDELIAKGISENDSRVKSVDAKVSELVEETALELGTITTSLDELIVEKTKVAQAARDQAFSVASDARIVVSAVMVFALIASILLGQLLSRSISRVLQRIISGLRDASGSTAAAADQLAGASEAVAQGNSEQASSIETTAVAIEEITGQINSNSQNAVMADSLAREAKEAADQGNSSMYELHEAMTHIGDSSNQIGAILKVIEEIAFQTNLLALNAAVEAARAGEHGKGFAVVADEVRNLAQRAGTAVKDTSTLIQESTRKADSGRKLTDKTMAELERITLGVAKLADVIAEISAASQEQASEVLQINSTVSQMTQVTQSTATSADEAATASEELSAQAVQLIQMVGELEQVVWGGREQPSAQKALTGG